MTRVIWSGVDTLEASFWGQLDKEFAERLAMLKAKAQREEHPQYLEQGVFNLAVQPQGLRPWAYLLKSDNVHLRVGTSPQFPTASARLLAVGLASFGHKALYDAARWALHGIGADTEGGLSRLDLAVDFQGWVPTVAEMDNVVCNSPFRPIYPSTRNPETYVFGKGDIMVRVYNKTRELAVSGKSWMHALWQESPDYDPELDVWRFEVQFRGEALKEYEMRYAADAFANLDGLLGVGLDWANLRMPRGASSDRWEEDPRWTALREGAGANRYLERVRVESRIGYVEQLIPMIAGMLMSVGARLGLYDLDMLLAVVAAEVQKYAARDGLDFEELTRRRAEKLLGG